MSFLVHKEGPGAITYQADVAILNVASEIMQDYLNQVQKQTTVAYECAKAGAIATQSAGEKEAKQLSIQGFLGLGGGLAGGVTFLGSELKSLDSFNKIASAQKELENIQKTRETLNKLDTSNSKLSLNATGVYNEQKINEIISNTKSHNYKDPLALNVESVDRSKTFTQENLNELDSNTKKEIIRELDNKKEFAEHRYSEEKRKIDHLFQIANMANLISQMCKSVSDLISSPLKIAEKNFEAARMQVQQSGEFSKQADNINSQGAQNAYDQMQKALQAFSQVVAANTRA